MIISHRVEKNNRKSGRGPRAESRVRALCGNPRPKPVRQTEDEPSPSLFDPRKHPQLCRRQRPERAQLLRPDRDRAQVLQGEAARAAVRVDEDTIRIPPDIDTPIPEEAGMVMLGSYAMFEKLKRN